MSTFPWFIGNQLSGFHPSLWAPPTRLTSPLHLSWPSPLLISQATPLTLFPSFVTHLAFLPGSPSLPPQTLSLLSRAHKCPGLVGASGVHAEFTPATAGFRLRGCAWLWEGQKAKSLGQRWEVGDGSHCEEPKVVLPQKGLSRPTWPKFTAACWAEAVKITTVRYSDNFSLLLMDLGKPKTKPQTMSSVL